MDRVRALQLLLALAFASWPYAQCKIKFPWVTGVAHASFYGGEDAGDTNCEPCTPCRVAALSIFVACVRA